MISVVFSNHSIYEFIKILAEGGWQEKFQVKFTDSIMEVKVSKTELARLLTRLSTGLPTVTPYRDNGNWYWIVTAPDGRTLDKTIKRLEYFLIPSYSEVLDSKGVAKLQKFDPDKGGFNLSGYNNFPHGYYLLRSPQEKIEKIFEMLDLWIGLDDAKPALAIKDRPSYFEMYQTFNENLSLSKWAEAQKALDNIRRLSLSTAENISFLRIQLWGTQKDWRRIWELPDFPELSKLTMPRNVRAHMLASFYWQVVHPCETQNNVESIFQALGDFRSKLGRLMTGRFGIVQPEVLRVFAYLATKDQNSEGFESLVGAMQSTGLQELVTSLKNRFPINSNFPTSDDQKVLVRQALVANDFDSAKRLTSQLDNSLDQALLYIQIAILSGDQNNEPINLAFQTYDKLSEEQREKLFELYPQTPGWLRVLENTVNQPEFLSAWDPSVSDLRLKAWTVITEFEIRLRKLVEQRYRNFLGPQWWSLIPSDFTEKWQKASGNNLDFQKAIDILDYSYLSDLDKLTRKKWEYFQDIFGNIQTDRTFFRKSMEKIITVRNTVAHNRVIDVEDLKIMIDCGILLIKKVDTGLGDISKGSGGIEINS